MLFFIKRHNEIHGGEYMTTISQLNRLEHFDWVEIACAQKHGSCVPGHLCHSLVSCYSIIKLNSRLICRSVHEGRKPNSVITINTKLTQLTKPFQETSTIRLNIGKCNGRVWLKLQEGLHSHTV